MSDERYVLVPVVATAEMVRAGSVAIEKADSDNIEPEDAGFFWGCSWQTSFKEAWSASIAAAPPPDDAVIERVARALCEGDNWDAISFLQTANGEEPEEQRDYWRGKATAAIAALCGGRVDG